MSSNIFSINIIDGDVRDGLYKINQQLSEYIKCRLLREMVIFTV